MSDAEKHLAGWLPQYQGDLALWGQDKEKARRFYRDSLSEFRRRPEEGGVFLALSGLSATEEAERASRLHGAAQVLGETDERVSRLLKSHGQQQQMYENAVAVSRAALGDEAFTAAMETGRAMTWEQAMEYALSAA